MTPPDEVITAPILTSKRARHGRSATVIGVASAFLLFMGGLYLLGHATSAIGSEFWVFLAGILVCSLAFSIPLEALRWFDRK